MNNIKTSEDVLNWAKTIVDAKGEKYIPLAKADMLAIAQFIVDVRDSTKPILEDKDPLEVEKDEEAPKLPPPFHTAGDAADSKSIVEETKTSGDLNNTTTCGKQTTTATMMRSYALHRAGFTVQQAYDKFLEWSKEHPKEASVMDFSTGVKSSNAAFAYWLSEILTVEVPPTTTRM